MDHIARAKHMADEQRAGMPLSVKTYGDDYHLNRIKEAIGKLEVPVSDYKAVNMANNATATIDDAIKRHSQGDANGASTQSHAAARQVIDLASHVSKNHGATPDRELYSGYAAVDHAIDYTDTVVQAKDDEFRNGE